MSLREIEDHLRAVTDIYIDVSNERLSKIMEVKKLKNLLSYVLPHLPGSIVTRDVGKCIECGTATSSGMQKLCLTCLRKRIRAVIQS